MAMIEVKNLTKRYRDRIAIDGRNFSFGEGEILGFLGPNGAGKAPTMRTLTGFLPARGATPQIAGSDVSEPRREGKGRLGFLPETPPLYLEMTVRSYLEFVARLK